MNYVEQFSTMAMALASAIGVIAMVVSIMVEVLKAVPAINKLPTKLVVFFVSIVITPACVIAYRTWQKQPIEWFMVFASFIAAFVIALVSMSGWQAVAEIAERCIKKDKKK